MTSAEAPKLNTTGSPDTMDDPVGGSPEKKKTYREIGAERREVFSKSISKRKAWLAGWAEKAKGFLSKTKDAAVDYAFASPIMAKDAVVGTAHAANDKFNTFVDVVDTRVQKAERAFDKKVEAGKKWGKEVAASTREGIKDLKLTAEVIGDITKQAYEGKVAEIKEDLASGYEQTMSRGKALIEGAQKKGAAAIQAFRTWKNNKRLEALERKENAARQQLEAIVEQKMKFQESFFDRVAA